MCLLMHMLEGCQLDLQLLQISSLKLPEEEGDGPNGRNVRNLETQGVR